MSQPITKITVATAFAAAFLLAIPANAQLANGNTANTAIPAPGTKHSNPNSPSDTAVGDVPAAANENLAAGASPTSDVPSTHRTRRRQANTDSTNATMPGTIGHN